jgi:hypothetical protein
VCPVITELALINEPYLLFFLTECEILLDIFNRQKHGGYSIQFFDHWITRCALKERIFSLTRIAKLNICNRKTQKIKYE